MPFSCHMPPLYLLLCEYPDAVVFWTYEQIFHCSSNFLDIMNLMIKSLYQVQITEFYNVNIIISYCIFTRTCFSHDLMDIDAFAQQYKILKPVTQYSKSTNQTHIAFPTRRVQLGGLFLNFFSSHFNILFSLVTYSFITCTFFPYLLLS